MRIEICFTHEVIVIPALDLNSRETGAVAEFLGIVREKEGLKSLAGLSYEAYQPMAEQLLSRLFCELNEQAPCFSVHFIHRLGWVPVGESSLFIRVQTAHRAEAFQFLSEAIRRLKIDVPIWKIA